MVIAESAVKGTTPASFIGDHPLVFIQFKNTPVQINQRKIQSIIIQIINQWPFGIDNNLVFYLIS